MSGIPAVFLPIFFILRTTQPPNMRSIGILANILTLGSLVKALPSPGNAKEPSCRFAHQYSQNEILRDPTAFVNDLLYWEGKFHQNNISYNSNNGVTYDGTNIDWVTGEATLKHSTSAASKEVN